MRCSPTSGSLPPCARPMIESRHDTLAAGVTPRAVHFRAMSCRCQRSKVRGCDRRDVTKDSPAEPMGQRGEPSPIGVGQSSAGPSNCRPSRRFSSIRSSRFALESQSGRAQVSDAWVSDNRSLRDERRRTSSHAQTMSQVTQPLFPVVSSRPQNNSTILLIALGYVARKPYLDHRHLVGDVREPVRGAGRVQDNIPRFDLARYPARDSLGAIL